MFIERNLSALLTHMLEKFPVVSLTGPRQSGKTTFLKHTFPQLQYINLERIDQREMISSDPVGYLKDLGSGVIFDEAQNMPELFSYIQVISDERNKPGQYILSGSQSFLLNKHISQSLAGRTYISHLYPFDVKELKTLHHQNLYTSIIKGAYPRIYDQNIDPEDFYPSYIQTYVDRDIRTLRAIENMSAFTRFLALCAGRIGQVLNISSLANDTGIAVNTAKSWLYLLESSFIIYLLRPWYKNFNKRVIKAPKLYFMDTGLACSLLNIHQPETIKTHHLYGALFENLIIAEIIKYSNHKGIQPKVYYWRESNGTEIDCIIEKGPDKITAIEIKGGQTFNRDYLKNLAQFRSYSKTLDIESILIYTGEKISKIYNISVSSWNDFPYKLEEIITV
jgi:predicted AAA+ superfamily ATPase